ncbi:RabGAP/TBC [Eremomyces bilateralis CBS 781.70]|uniref:GTPase-activating protein GYP5 n=1 Tax=Eremomyces bilateralis CBS 781.70 TaxID=1392243 RepID=A0A6G1FSB1_9PEZI|nr:RabGAP/TBC [Eremomyces bilateralis CBS 781.70]KAF1808569.1 RabGAP/TBC [Eremomyces bilateralis CBS 781.70]
MAPPTRKELRPTTPESTEDAFEDAPDITPRPHSNSPKTSRSLTDRSTSSGSRKLYKGNGSLSKENTAAKIAKFEGRAHAGGNGVEVEAPQKSPLLTTHGDRGDHGEVTDMDEVSLDEVKLSSAPPPIPASSTTDFPLRPMPSNIAANDTNTNAQAPPTPDKHASTASSASPFPSLGSRKLTAPFSWLSRTSPKPSTPSPPLPRPIDTAGSRRNTASSTTTLSSNPDVPLSHLSRLAEEGSPTTPAAQNSRGKLRDRFKLLRMQEEAGVNILSLESDDSTTASGLGIAHGGQPGGAMSPDKERDDPSSVPTQPTPPAKSQRSMSISSVQTINRALPPGTASGLAEAEKSGPVDWDLWQSIVYEGPAAVARTSPEEMKEGIALGIPGTIRGVVWQVLSGVDPSPGVEGLQDLAQMYWGLVAKGTEKEKEKIDSAPMSRAGSQSTGNGVPANGSVQSSGSSVSEIIGPGQPSPGTAPPHESTSSGFDVRNLREKLSFAAKKPSVPLLPGREKEKDDPEMIRKLEKTIRKDIGARTSYSKYLMAAGLQEGLFGVCKAYALYDGEVGYAQGMNFVAMPLLFNMPEEEAFALLVRLMQTYHLRDLFAPEMPGLHLHLYQFARLLEDLEPALYCHLNRRGATPNLYATQWFLTLFAYRFPLQLVLRIYDLILSEGLEASVLKFGIALMQKNRDLLLGMHDMSQLTMFLKERLVDAYIDKAPSASSLLDSGFFGSSGSGADREIYRAEELVRDACAIPVTEKMLSTYSAEWKEQLRETRERETELETLRSQGHTLSAKVRRLEEDAEKSDHEHVLAASELVRIKVENQTLEDVNESLKGQVEELKKVVASQTEEVEARLKADMDKVMHRNIEVHNENRALEDQMTEMEKELVEAKMGYAQINSEYETLKQKWHSITTMLNNK